MQTIPLKHLHAHPANSNVMPEDRLAKLADHIARSGHYPPLIVRPLNRNNQDANSYQIIDGHHRAQALKRLGIDQADCIVWQTDDHETLLLLATLNRLQGRDDPHKRASLIAELADRHDNKALAKRLPERMEQIRKLIEINQRTPKPRPPQPLESMPVAVHFFLLPDQKRLLDQRLKTLGGTREQALMQLVEHTDPAPSSQK